MLTRQVTAILINKKIISTSVRHQISADRKEFHVLLHLQYFMTAFEKKKTNNLIRKALTLSD